MNEKLKAFGIFAFSLAFGLGVGLALKQADFGQSAARDNAQVQKQMADAARARPDLPAAEAMRQDALARSEQRLAAESDLAKRGRVAADTFWGFYFVNTRMRREFCSEQGVDVTAFVSAFERAHMNELAKARSLYARSGMDETLLYEGLRPTARKVIEQDMHDIAAAQGLSLSQACEALASAAEELVPEMHLSKMQPAIFKALVAAP